MKMIALVATVVLSLVALSPSWAQPWAPILGSDRAIDWSDAGAGHTPARTNYCARLAPTASFAQINSALASCPAGDAVYLEAGTYSITRTIYIPSNVTLRGAGAGVTILNATGTSGGDVISMGTGDVSYVPNRITKGASAKSNKVEVSDASGIKMGMHLAIGETNNPAYVSALGSGGECKWCDGGWTEKGSLARGQIVEVTGVKGKVVSFLPGLYSAYTESPVAVPFNMSAQYAGVEDLQVYANNTGYRANFGMSRCAHCWIKGVMSNYADGDHIEIHWGFHDEVRDSYFSNAFVHTPGMHDSDIQLGFKTSASLVENNIIERTHVAVMLEWGAAGNVVAYNYATGEFDSSAVNLDIGGIDFHGAHPQFNLLEGNVVAEITEDSVWGSSSHTTAFRNWVVGTNHICGPMNGRGVVTCSGTNGHYGFQAVRAVEISYLGSANNFIGNVIGSAKMQALKGYNYQLTQQASIEYPEIRSYDAVAYGWSFGYGKTSDDGMGTGCGGGVPPCHRTGTMARNFFDGNYNDISRLASWAHGVPRQLLASLYLQDRPAWWGAMPFPATGPDVTGGNGPGGHSYGNPAQACYLHVMEGEDGGAGAPLSFDPSRCYGADRVGAPVTSRSVAAGHAIVPEFDIRQAPYGEKQ